MVQHQSRTGPLLPNEQNIFYGEDTAGYQPSRPRIQLGPRIPSPLWITDVPRPFQFDSIFGTQGVVYPAPRLHRAPRIGQPIYSDAITTFFSEVGFGFLRFPHQHQRRTGPLLSEGEAPFSNEDVIGSQPDRPRLFKSPRFKSAFVEETIIRFEAGTLETYPTQRPKWKPIQRSKFTFNVINVDSSQILPDWGKQPEKPRIFLAPRIGLPVFVQPVPIFSPEMVQGNQPSRSRVWLAPRIPLPLIPEPKPVLPFDFNTIYGLTVPSPRLFLAPRIPLPLSQTTHVQNAFSIDMVSADQPKQPRITRGPRLQQPPWIEIPFTIGPEQTVSHHPDQPRLFLGPRIGLPITREALAETAVSNEMFAAYVLPAQPRGPLKPPLQAGDVTGAVIANFPFTLNPNAIFFTGVTVIVPSFTGDLSNSPLFTGTILVGNHMPSGNVLYVANDNTVWLRNYTNTSTGQYENAATVTVTLLDSNGANVVGPIAMTYVTSSNGRYKGTIPAATPLTDGSHYEAQVDAVSAAGTSRWFTALVAVERSR